MAALSFDNARLGHQVGQDHRQKHGVLIEEIEGLIRVYKDGHVERPPVVPIVDCAVSTDSNLACRDVIIDKFTNVWARFYVPRSQGTKLPFLVYFHGGGFCVGSTAWSCYHEFLAKLATKAGCVVMSVNYRLSPEHRLPAAYEDGVCALMWVRREILRGSSEQKWWWSHCNLSQMFLGGDSAGANIAHHVTTRVGQLAASSSSSSDDDPNILKPMTLKGTILIQPFFGGEARTYSEKYMVQPPKSALTVAASDVYWRLSLPLGANRDHQWCNPFAKGAMDLEDLRVPPIMVCISELDILKDRNLEFCNGMSRAGKRVEHVMYMGVGHAFQVLHHSQLSQARAHEMMSHIKAFINQE
ncbi:hypothetical protein Syun_021640 [Stephania yunnanensis]|uniref:Alpha/beta hydrolase fold-3 domain-containing protein n=1 Tax=Stephania yunnanensis TaxID=152371 RepID=A0AAP0IGZ7_9MAGN